MPNQYPLLWYTSNSPISRGQRDCGMRRYTEYHAGPHGSGYRRKATAVPLATGKATHVGIELIGNWILEWQAQHGPMAHLTELPDDVVAWAALEAADAYERRAQAKGLMRTMGESELPAEITRLILEQRTLVEALVWVYALARLPYMLSEYRLICVEFEEGMVFDCSCGLGDGIGQIADHEARSCHGIADQGKADLIWEHVHTGAVIYEEIKTKASEKKSWADAWDHSSQLWLNMEAASRRLGRPVNDAFITVLYKGWRGRPRGSGEDVPKTQQTTLVYGYYDPGAPPIRAAEWKSQYKWHDDYGKGHTLPHSYQKQAVWNEILPLAPLFGRPDASRVEQWVRGYFKSVNYLDHITVLGPFPRPVYRLADATAAVLAEERLWRAKVEYLRENNAFEPSHPLVVEQIPRSWNCTSYDSTRCDFYGICTKQPGWESIESMGIFEIRTPHHAPERAAYEALGVVFPGEDDEDEDGGEE